MNVQELLTVLLLVKDKSIPVCFAESNEYWGTLHNEISSCRFVEHGQPDGCKEEPRPIILLDDI